MLRKAKAKLSDTANVDLKIVKFRTTKLRLLLCVIVFAVLLKFVFTMSCSWNTSVISGSTKPMSIDSDLIKVGVHEKGLEQTNKEGKESGSERNRK